MKAIGIFSRLALLFCLLALGIALRLPGFDGRSLWIDELWRVNLILEQGSIAQYWNSPSLYTAITAPLYLQLNSLLGLIDPSPVFLRLSSFIPGLVSIVLAFFISRKAGACLSWSLGVAVLFAANAHFIRYSNEFKPYMFEVMVHLACLFLWLDILKSSPVRNRQWVVFSFALLVATLCTANIVFELAAMAVSLIEKVRRQERDKLGHALVSFCVVGVAVITLYFLVWSYGSNKELISYWADSFYDPARSGYLAFIGKQFLGMCKGAFAPIGAGSVMRLIFGLSLFYVLYACWRRRLFVVQPMRGVLIYGFVLAFTVLVLNHLDLWPIGEVRPNQFLFAIIAIWCAMILSIALSAKVQGYLAALVVAVMALGFAKTGWERLADLGPPREQSDRVWAAFAASETVGKSILERCEQKPVTVFANPGMTLAYRYYAEFGGRPKNSSLLSSQCVEVKFVPDAYADADALRSQITRIEPSGGLHWYVFSHLNDAEVRMLKDVAQEFGVFQPGEDFLGAGYFSVMGRSTSKWYQ